MIRANVTEDEEQTLARFLNGLNHPIEKIVDFKPYSNLVELVHQASKAKRQVQDNYKYAKYSSKTYNSYISSSNDYDAFYLDEPYTKQRRQVKLQENFDIFKSSSYYKQPQAESFIITYSNG